MKWNAKKSENKLRLGTQRCEQTAHTVLEDILKKTQSWNTLSNTSIRAQNNHDINRSLKTQHGVCVQCYAVSYLALTKLLPPQRSPPHQLPHAQELLGKA